jgi:hypothetical protein
MSEAVEMIKVESSNVDSVGHYGGDVLRVQFKGSGPPYDYRPIAATEFQGILKGSAGSKVNEIKNRVGVMCAKVVA